MLTNEIRDFKLWDFEERKEIELSFKKAGDHRWKALCYFHKEKHESLYYYDLTESYICYGCGRHGVSHEKYLRYIEALKPYNLTEKLGDPVASYPYKDEEGNLLYQKFKFEKRNEKGELIKTFRIWRPDSKGGIIRNIQGVRRVLYNLDKINNSGDKPIFLFEGEKDCDNLMTRFEGVLATTSDIGAGKGFKKWRPEYYDFFQDRNIIIIPDNDKISRIFYRDIGNNLVGIAKSAKWLILPGLEEHGDITDWLMAGGTLEELFKLIEEAPEFPLPVPIEDRIEVNLKEILESNLPPEEMIIGDGIMGINNYCLIVSRHKKGKTLFSLNLALNLISKTPFLETYPVMKNCKVLYVFSESNVFNLNKVMSKQIEGLKELGIIIPKESFKNFHSYNTRKELLTISLTPSDDLSRLQKCLDTFEPDVIIVDPISRIAIFNMNKAENITLFSNLMIRMRDCVWVIVHHTRKEETKPRLKNPPPIDEESLFDSIRGSSAWCNNADTIICLTRSGEDLPPNFLKVFFESKRGFEPLPLEVKFDTKTLNYELIDITDLHKKVRITYSDMMEYIIKNFPGKKVKNKDLINTIGQRFKVTPMRVCQLLSEANDKGHMVKEKGKFGKWYISEQGKLF